MKKSLMFISLIVAFLMLQGCSKLTKVNYDKIEMGMVKSDVEMVLGKADQCEEMIGTYSCVWGDLEGKHIKINFIGGRAAVFSHEGLE